MTRHVLSMADFAPGEIEQVLDLAYDEQLPPVLTGRGAALIFEHPSARTRNAMEMAVVQLGGHPLTIRGEEVGFDVRESVEDVAATLACFHSLLGARVAKHVTLERLVAGLGGDQARVPLINLLSDREHPSQTLADLLTMRACLGRLKGLQVAFIGDSNNVCRSLAFGCALVGAHLRVASPEGFQLSDADQAQAKSLGGAPQLSSDPEQAARGADVLYTDVFVSMGESSEKRAAFSGFCLDEHLLELASPEAIVLHCLPAHRGEEITAGVIDGPQSRVWAQAENRMHSLRALIAYLFGVCD